MDGTANQTGVGNNVNMNVRRLQHAGKRKNQETRFKA